MFIALYIAREMCSKPTNVCLMCAIRLLVQPMLFSSSVLGAFEGTGGKTQSLSASRRHILSSSVVLLATLLF